MNNPRQLFGKQTRKRSSFAKAIAQHKKWIKQLQRQKKELEEERRRIEEEKAARRRKVSRGSKCVVAASLVLFCAAVCPIIDGLLRFCNWKA